MCARTVSGASSAMGWRECTVISTVTTAMPWANTQFVIAQGETEARAAFCAPAADDTLRMR